MMNDIELAPYIEDLTWALENDVDIQMIEAELKNYVNNFHLPIDEAKRCILKKFGIEHNQIGKVIDKNIIDLRSNETSVNLLCKILYIEDKEITVDGKPKMISYGILGDTTGTASFTAWHRLECEKGEVIRIYNAYTRQWQDKVQINLGDRTHVRLMEPDTLPELINIDIKEFNDCKVEDLSVGLKNVKLKLRILDIHQQEITANEKQLQIFRGVGADETGKCRFAAWSDFNLTQNDVVLIQGGYVKSWRGVPELQLNGGTIITKLIDDELPDFATLVKDRVVPIRNLKRLGGASSVALEGVILDIRPTSGLIKRCPECNRVLTKEACVIHGKVNGIFDLRVKGVLDDGSGAITIVLQKEITERILGLDINGCIERSKEFMRYEIIYEDLIEKLLARPVRIIGTVIYDEFGLMMIGSSMEMIKPKIKTEAASILTDLGIEFDNEVWKNE